MPWRTEWVAPEVFLEHEGVVVYHSYKDNDMGSRMTYWYTTNPEHCEEIGGEVDPYEFDVRDLTVDARDAPRQVVDALAPPLPELEQIADTIRRAIHAGIIRVPPATHQ
jgi:hypothetical protein